MTSQELRDFYIKRIEENVKKATAKKAPESAQDVPEPTPPDSNANDTPVDNTLKDCPDDSPEM